MIRGLLLGMEWFSRLECNAADAVFLSFRGMPSVLKLLKFLDPLGGGLHLIEVELLRVYYQVEGHLGVDCFHDFSHRIQFPNQVLNLIGLFIAYLVHFVDGDHIGKLDLVEEQLSQGNLLLILSDDVDFLHFLNRPQMFMELCGVHHRHHRIQSC